MCSSAERSGELLSAWRRRAPSGTTSADWIRRQGAAAGGDEPEARLKYGHQLKGRMAEVLLFHHAQGQTAGFLAFAERLRRDRNTVHTPDLYDGHTFASIDEGVAYAKKVGFGVIADRGRKAAEGLPNGLVYAGFSLGVMPAQSLAQTRPGAKGALLFSAAFPAEEFGRAWPEGVPLQIHMMEEDKWVQEGDLDAARKLVSSVKNSELFLYPGNRHLFADSSLSDYDPKAAAQLTERVLAFLKRTDSKG